MVSFIGALGPDFLFRLSFIMPLPDLLSSAVRWIISLHDPAGTDAFVFKQRLSKDFKYAILHIIPEAFRGKISAMEWWKCVRNHSRMQASQSCSVTLLGGATWGINTLTKIGSAGNRFQSASVSKFLL